MRGEKRNCKEARGIQEKERHNNQMGKAFCIYYVQNGMTSVRTFI